MIVTSSSAKDRRVGYLALMHGEHAETGPENPQQKIKWVKCYKSLFNRGKVAVLRARWFILVTARLEKKALSGRNEIG